MTALFLGLFLTPALAADTLRIAVQRTGTVAWELAVAKARGLDKAADLDIRIEELASTEAGKISLRGGAVDMIVSDWLWVARERGLGDDLLFTPYSTALGAVMAPKTSTIASIADLKDKIFALKGKSIGIAGGPLDKSWLMLRALARRSGLDLAKQTRPIYGAPPLIAAKLIQGETDAALEFWNFCADLEAHGFKRVIEMSDVEKGLGAKGPVAMTGYVFSAAFARAHGPALKRFFAMLAKAHEALATDPAAWAPVRARLRATDAATFEAYRRGYLAGAPMRPVADEAADARALFKAIADVSGAELTGGAKDLDVTAFYDPGR